MSIKILHDKILLSLKLLLFLPTKSPLVTANLQQEESYIFPVLEATFTHFKLSSHGTILFLFRFS
jgi:hypothetical protein